MSDHAHAGAAHGHAHADHHYVYEGTPANEPGADEPVTPGWLTLLGITLVLAVMLGFIATRPDGKTRAELSGATTGAGAATAAPAATAPAPVARPVPSGARPGMQPADLLRRLDGAQRPGQPPGQFAVQPGRPAPGGRPVAPSVPQ